MSGTLDAIRQLRLRVAIRLAEIDAVEMRPAKIAVFEMRSVEGDALEIRPAEAGVFEMRIAEVGAAQVGRTQIEVPLALRQIELPLALLLLTRATGLRPAQDYFQHSRYVSRRCGL